MSLEYAESRIKEALVIAKGNPTRARQQVIAWTYEDPKLLHALAKPHLTGIVAHAVSRVIHRQNLETEQVSAPEEPQVLDMSAASFGQQLLETLQNQNTAVFGHEGAATPLKRKQASKAHIEALKKMANKNGDEE